MLKAAKDETSRALATLRMLRRKKLLGFTDCPAETTSAVIGEKWKVLIIRELLSGTIHFGALRRGVPGISHKMLIQQLRDLIDDGVVRREAGAEGQPKVYYSLTAAGERLATVLLAIHKWGKRHSARKSRRDAQSPGKKGSG